jgi:hypothetical protein
MVDFVKFDAENELPVSVFPAVLCAFQEEAVITHKIAAANQRRYAVVWARPESTLSNTVYSRFQEFSPSRKFYIRRNFSYRDH